jgi:phospholipase/carboxylesterase
VLTTYIKESHQPAQACVIWLHGLGADAANMMGVADAFPESFLPIRHVFVDAPLRPVTLNNHMTMRAWYDITGLTLEDREDKEGILQSEQMILEIIAEQVSKGIALNQIYLAGFSQGGAIALFIAMRTRLQLAGVLALSSYLPLQVGPTYFYSSGVLRSSCLSKLDKIGL